MPKRIPHYFLNKDHVLWSGICSYPFLYPNKETVRRGRVKLGSPQGNALPSELSRLDSFEVLFLLTAALEKNL